MSFDWRMNICGKLKQDAKMIKSTDKHDVLAMPIEVSIYKGPNLAKEIHDCVVMWNVKKGSGEKTAGYLKAGKEVVVEGSPTASIKDGVARITIQAQKFVQGLGPFTGTATATSSSAASGEDDLPF